jgi:hypothetical protein
VRDVALFDPLVFGGAMHLVVVVALAASLGAGRSAAAVDPAVAMGRGMPGS